MILYVNGDSHSAGAEAVNQHCFAKDDTNYRHLGRVPHPDNESVSYGALLADNLNLTLQCSAESGGSNTRIIRTTRDYLKNNPTPTAIIIGWATWERAWNLFQSNGSKLLKELESKKLVKEFDLDGAYEYTKMLSDQISGKNDSWAIRWDASMFLENKLSLYPSISLVKNIGFDGEGSHCEISNDYNTIISEKKIEVFSVPLNEDKKARKLLSKFYHKIRFKNRVDRLKSIFRF